MAFKYNPITKKLDMIGDSTGSGGPFFPYIPGSNLTSKFVDNGDTLELWWNGMLVESWTHTIVVGTGNPIGLLLSLTYS